MTVYVRSSGFPGQMYMSKIFTTCIYHVCHLLYSMYYSIVHTLYIHMTSLE